MDWYHDIAIIVIVSQVLYLLLAYRNYRYVLLKYYKPRLWQSSPVALIVPCKGLDTDFEQNIASLLAQEYENFSVFFVVAEESDPAYAALCRLKERLSGSCKAREVRILVAGRADSCSQKIHNLLHAYSKIPPETEILAFADSDICVRSNWLAHLVWPLREFRYGASSGYRWFIPKRNNLASIALSCLNAKVAQQLGNTRFNQAWGGSMAIHVETFRKVGLEKLWPRVLSDDLSLTYAVKKAGMKLAFVPACLVASYESTTWRKLLEFGRRQFLITRVYRPWTWFYGLLCCLYSVLCLWPTAALAVYAVRTGHPDSRLFVAVPVVFLLCQAGRAALRQRMICRVLAKDRENMRTARIADVFFSWAWSLLLLVLMLSSAVGRTICWRGIRYKLLGPTETIVKGGKSER